MSVDEVKEAESELEAKTEPLAVKEDAIKQEPGMKPEPSVKQEPGVTPERGSESLRSRRSEDDGDVEIRKLEVLDPLFRIYTLPI